MIWLLKVRRHLEKHEKILRRKKLKKFRKLTKSNEILFFECVGNLTVMNFFLFKHQFLNFRNSFVPNFEALHNLIHLNNFSDTNTIQKQPSRGVLRKRCSENMQQIYRRTPMLKCDGCSPVNLLHIFRTAFPRSTAGWLLLTIFDDSNISDSENSKSCEDTQLVLCILTDSVCYFQTQSHLDHRSKESII